MLGNDVVDMRTPLGEGRHPRFDARVFTDAERTRLGRLEGTARERFRQVLWACKESAYKALRRVDAATVWSPRRFEVRLPRGFDCDVVSGHVRHRDWQLEVCVDADAERVHAVAHASGTGRRPLSAIRGLGREPGPDEASAAVRSLARELLEEAAGVCAVGFERRGRAPVAIDAEGEEIPVTLSLSHDGRFVACAAATASPCSPRLEGATHD